MARIAFVSLGAVLTVAGLTLAEPPDTSPADALQGSLKFLPPSVPVAYLKPGPDNEAAPVAGDAQGRPAGLASADNPGSRSADGNQGGGNSGTVPISGNPAADNITVGTGRLGELLGFDKDSGIRFGGMWSGDSSWLATGGLEPGRWSLNSLSIADLTLDSNKPLGWKGGLFGIEFLQFSGQPTNEQAGSVQAYDNIEATPPLVRQEIYNLWWRQEFFDGKRSSGSASRYRRTTSIMSPVPRRAAT